MLVPEYQATAALIRTFSELFERCIVVTVRKVLVERFLRPFLGNRPLIINHFEYVSH